MEIFSFIQYFFVFLILVFIHIRWAKHRLKEWAKKKNYTLVTCRFCLTNIGPYSYFGTSGGQSVFKIEVSTEQGEIKKGYARVGGFFFGLLRKRVEVKWNNISLNNNI